MKILALETSTDCGSLALYLDGEVIQRSAEGRTSHSEWVLPTLASLLADAGVTLCALDAIAFGAGPGSFTGLRLACGIAQGLAIGSGVPLLPVCSLAAVALQTAASQVLVCVDARMDECYWAAYRGADVPNAERLECVIAPAVGAPEHLPMPTTGSADGWIGAGDGFINYRPRLPSGLLDALQSFEPGARPQAGALVRLAVADCRAGRFVSVADAAPLYVRDKVAYTTAERLAAGAKA